MGAAAKVKTSKPLEISRAKSGELSSKSLHTRLSNNLEFIATYLFMHYGAGAADVRRALCRYHGKEYHRGMYCSYFASMPRYKRNEQYRDRYWTKIDKGWYLTTQGMGLVRLERKNDV